MCVACSSSTVLEEQDAIDAIGKDPISFSGMEEAAMAHTAMMTRSPLLTSGFVVSTYKNYGSTDWSADLHTVMPRYQVDYKENRDDWNGVVSSSWNYINITNPWTGNRQEEKFWDYSGFPYRFHAIAPANGNIIYKENIVALGNEAFELNASYKAQTFIAPAVPSSDPESPSTTPSNADAEPYLLAQVSRNANGEDLDIIKNTPINTATTTKNRRVWMPFHHLNSKVRFGVYTLNLSQTAQHDYISDLVITVEKLATSASSYKAYGQSSWVSNNGYSYFQGINVEDNKTIFTFNPSVPSSEPEGPSTSYRSYADNDLSLHQGRGSVYWLECPDGIMQLPQNGVKIHVSMKIIKEDNTERFIYHDYEIKQETPTLDPTHWQAGCIHTYYLCLDLNDEKLPILTVTATLTPWEDISGSLNTDLEQ